MLHTRQYLFSKIWLQSLSKSSIGWYTSAIVLSNPRNPCRKLLLTVLDWEVPWDYPLIMTLVGNSLPLRWMEKGKKANPGGPIEELPMNHVDKTSSKANLGLNGLSLKDKKRWPWHRTSSRLWISRDSVKSPVPTRLNLQYNKNQKQIEFPENGVWAHRILPEIAWQKKTNVRPPRQWYSQVNQSVLAKFLLEQRSECICSCLATPFLFNTWAIQSYRMAMTTGNFFAPTLPIDHRGLRLYYLRVTS